jgi:hypothetical protein
MAARSCRIAICHSCPCSGVQWRRSPPAVRWSEIPTRGSRYSPPRSTSLALAGGGLGTPARARRLTSTSVLIVWLIDPAVCGYPFRTIAGRRLRGCAPVGVARTDTAVWDRSYARTMVAAAPMRTTAMLTSAGRTPAARSARPDVRDTPTPATTGRLGDYASVPSHAQRPRPKKPGPPLHLPRCKATCASGRLPPGRPDETLAQNRR